MTVAGLIENIKKLPRFPQDLLDRFAERRKQLGRDFGQFDSAQAIMEFREARIQMRLVVDASVAIKWP